MAREALGRSLAGFVSRFRPARPDTIKQAIPETSNPEKKWDVFEEYARLYTKRAHAEEEARPLLLEKIPEDEIDRFVYSWSLVHDLSTLDRYKSFDNINTEVKYATRQPQRSFWTKVDTSEIPKDLKKALVIKQNGMVDISFGVKWLHPQVHYLDSRGYRAAYGHIDYTNGHADIFAAVKDAEDALVIGSDVPARRLFEQQLVGLSDKKYNEDGSVEERRPRFSFESTEKLLAETAVFVLKCAEKELRANQTSQAAL